MLPIKYGDDDSFLSDFSLHSTFDKETQTEPKCITGQLKEVIVTKPGVIEQDIETILKYRDILNDSGIINSNISIENIKQHREGVLSAHSSHGTFIFGNILKHEDPVGSHLNEYWRLDDSIEREFPNSGYVYIPCVEAKNDSKEDTSNKVCIFIPNQETREHLENNQDIIKNQLIEITSTSNPIKKSFHSKASKEKVSPHISFISNAVEEPTNLINPINTSSFHSKTSKEKVSAHASFINNAVEEPTNIINPINKSFHSKTSKEKVSAHTSFINNAVEEPTNLINSINKYSFHSKASESKVSAHASFIKNIVEEPTNLINPLKKSSLHSKASKEKVAHISFISNAVEEQTNLIDINRLEDMPDKKSCPPPPQPQDPCPPPSEVIAKRLNNLAQGVKNCLSNTISAIATPICRDICNKTTEKTTRSLETNTPSEGLIARIKRSLCSLIPQIRKPPENKEKEEEKRPSSPSTSSPPPKPRNCSSDMESTETIGSLQITPLINEMSPNNEFATEDYVFNNNQLTPMNLEVVHKLSEDARIRTDVNDVLSSAASNTTEDISSSNDEYSLDSQAKVHIPENSGLNQMAIRLVEPSVKDYKGLNLDRINESSERKVEASGAPSSEHIIRMIAPETISHSHTFAQPPRRGLFTAFKSTIFRFFGEKNVIEENSDSSFVSYNSSDNSED